MIRRSVPFAVIASIVAVAGCAVDTASDSAETSEAAVQQSAPIKPSLKADGNEAGYLAAIRSDVLPYCLPFAAAGSKTFVPGTYGNATFGKFVGAAGKNIAYGIYKAPRERAALVLVPGRTEPFSKYCELIYDARNSGITIYAMDLRGQGWSDRMLADTQKGFIDDFGNYVADIKTFRDKVVMATPHKKLVFFGHSTGGAAGTLYLEKYPGDFDGAVLHSPMHQINTSPYPEWFAEELVDFMMLIGKGADYAPGKVAYGEDDQFVDNGCEHSPERWRFMRNLMAQFPELKIGGPTSAWIERSIEATWTLKADAAKIKTPFLLLQARQDEIVITGAQDKVCGDANKNGAICTKVTFGDAALTAKQCDDALKANDLTTARRCAGHELMIEHDALRAQVEGALSDYVDQLTGTKR